MTRWIDQPATEHDDVSRELVELLTTLLKTPQDVQETIEDTPGIDQGDLAWPNPFRARRFWIENVVDLRAKGTLSKLIEHLADTIPPRRGDLVRYLELRIVQPGGWYSVDDPLEAQFVGSGWARPMIDRRDLRDNLDLLAKQGYRTLNILGPSASGKTFSLQLLQILAERSSYEVVHVDVKDWGTAPFDALELVGALAVQTKVAIDTTVVDNVPDPHTRARLLLYSLREALPACDTLRWIVVDGLDRPNVQPDAAAFVERLLKSIDEDNKPPNSRLVVTGFGGLLPQQTRREEIRAITRDDVADLFGVAATHLEHDITDDQRSTWTDEAMARYESSGNDLSELGVAVYDIFTRQMALAGHGDTGGGDPP